MYGLLPHRVPHNIPRPSSPITTSPAPHPRPGRIEKYIMRKAFDTPEKPYLPEEVLWRQKEQFSDGVGYNW